ncbi:MAG: arylsulfatase [Lentisphaeria bacterium]|nr:arylsulfatase [Lentisphaeria bacterium]
MSGSRPNIVIMYADDLGFGDLACYDCKDIPTPNLDRLAASGIRFTNGYATAATCTPSRYSLLTGSYPWRNPLAAILPGDAPQLVTPEMKTMPKMLKKAGYHTGIVGKWHLGLGDGNLDWNGSINGTPNDVGFDYSYIMAATNDRVPTVYVKNREVENLDPNDPIEVTYEDKPFPGEKTGRDNPELLRMKHSHGHDGTIVNGVGRIGHMRGGASALWNDETMYAVFLKEACEFVERSQEEPFFLYYAFHQPHVPRLPAPPFQGATKLGPRGDVIVEMDYCVGKFLDKLEELGIRENTIVIFSSDNGPVLDDGYIDEAPETNAACRHNPAGPLRGGKYSLYDGGTRVPTLLSWPEKVDPQVSDAVICHVDFHHSFAKMTGVALDEDEAIDSFDVLDALTGQVSTARQTLVTEGYGQKTLVRKDNWVYIPPYEGSETAWGTGNETGCRLYDQLYDMNADIAQASNVAESNPEKLAELKALHQEIYNSEASRS